MLCEGLDLLDRLEVVEKMRPNIISWLYNNLINSDASFNHPGQTFFMQPHLRCNLWHFV